MCILYKQTTKEFVHFDTKTKRSDLITDIRLASELTNAEAKELLKKCTKKLKGFQITQIESFQAKEPAAPAIVIPAQPAETTTATAESASSNTAGSSAANTTSASNDSADYKNAQAMLYKQRTKRNLYKG